MTSHPQARTSPYADQAHFCHRADLVVKIVNAIEKDERGFCLFIFHGFKLLVWKRECLAVSAEKLFVVHRSLRASPTRKDKIRFLNINLFS